MSFGNLDTRSYLAWVTGFLALFLAVLEPASSVPSHFLLRLLQWSLQVGIPILILIFVHVQLNKLARFDDLNPWAKLTIGGIAGALIFSPIALALDFLLGIENLGDGFDPSRLATLWANEISGVTGPITLAWIAINAPRVLRLDFRAAQQDEYPRVSEETESNFDTVFLTALPARLGRDFIYLKSELHYLRVVTTRGSSLVLFNLRDAVASMPKDSGVQTHRSYWVALSHVQRLVRHGSSCEVEVTNGDMIPVSRRQLSKVKRVLGN